MNSNTLQNNMHFRFPAEVLRWTYFHAYLFSFTLQMIVSTVVCTVTCTIFFDVNINFGNSFLNLIELLLKPRWIFTVLPVALCYVLLIRMFIAFYEVSSWIPQRRLQYLSEYFQPRKLAYSVSLLLVCSYLLQHYAFLIHPDFSSLTIQCVNSDKSCVNHQALLILVFGVSFGCRLSLKYFLANYRTIQIPIAYPNLLNRLKSKLQLRTVVEACSFFDIGFGFFATVYLTYLLLGGVISHWIGPLLGVSPSDETYPIWSILAMLFDVRFLATLLTCLVLLAFNLHCFFLIFQETLAQRIELPFPPEDAPLRAPAPASSWTLSNGLASSCKLLQLLAFRQLREIALDQTCWGRHYRAQMYRISQPGGHPRNWQSIVTPSLNLIRKFCDRLTTHNYLEKFSAQPSSLHSQPLQTDINKNQLSKGTPFSFKEKWMHAKESLKQFPFFCYLLSDLPDYKNRQIFAEGQSVIWAVEGLSNLVSTSYTDDQFGVVQKNLADILTTLVQLQLVVDKVGRGLPYRRVTQGTNFGSRFQMYPQDLQLRRSMRLTLRSSLYIITNTFKESIREIDVDAEVRSKLDSYLAFQEG